jgi:hypothetical protein
MRPKHVNLWGRSHAQLPIGSLEASQVSTLGHSGLSTLERGKTLNTGLSDAPSPQSDVEIGEHKHAEEEGGEKTDSFLPAIAPRPLEMKAWAGNSAV